MGYFEEQFGMHVQSKTKESQTAVFGDVRISVLTSRLLRVETMNAAKAFCDQPTQKVWYRDFEQPRFDASQEGQMLTVRTEQAIFHYNLRRKRMESITLRGGRTVTDFESGNLIQRMKSLIPILVPLFISAIRRANDLAMAMEARCYHGGAGRTKMKPLLYARRDYLAYMIILIYIFIWIAVKMWL